MMKAEESERDESACRQGTEGGGDDRGQRRERIDERARQAARSVMHPDPNDPEWRYYHGAWHS